MIVLNGSGTREISVEVQGAQVVFVITQENFGDFQHALRWARAEGLAFDGASPMDVGIAVSNFQLIRRVRSWRGIALHGGDPAPCTEETKLHFFGCFPGTLYEIRDKLNTKEEAEEKNSATSQAG